MGNLGNGNMKKLIIALVLAAASSTVFIINAQRTTAWEGNSMPSILKLTTDAKNMPEQSFPAF